MFIGLVSSNYLYYFCTINSSTIMARTIDEDTSYRVKIHKNGSYSYASTQPIVIDPDRKSGRNKHKRIHWGTIDENMKFHPNKNYISASPAERERLIFPPGWDMSEVRSLPSERKAGRPSASEEDSNLLYGDIWLLEHVAERTGLRSDLIKAFDGNKEMADAILTMAMYQVANGGSFNRMTHWQRIEKAPFKTPLTAQLITHFTQKVTEANRMELFRLRMARVKDGDLCALDSTSRSAYGDSLADIMWGNNKEHLPLRQTTDVIVYDLTTHMPIYYRTFPGNIPDSRSVGIILKDLADAGMPRVVLITDRGYESLRNLELYILSGQPMIMWVKVRQAMVLNRIREMGTFAHCPDGMEVDEDRHVYYRQYDLDYKVDVRKDCTKDADRLKLNLYFDPVRRSTVLMELDIDIRRQRRALEDAKAEGYPMDDDITLKRLYPCFILEVDESDRKLKSFTLNEKKVEEVRLVSGFSACVTHALDYTSVKASESYALRDEQEKDFGLQKGPLGSDRQRCWSEDGKNGRLFVLFVAMILGSYVRHIRQTTELKKMFCSFSEILDEMRPIRCIEHKGHARLITPFVGKQLEICRVFGFAVPEGCNTKYKSKKVSEKRRGRPKNAVVVSEPKE